jgi:hypothetical protein
MGQQEIAGSFPGNASAAGLLNIADAFPFGTGAWSSGGSLMVSLGIQPPLSERWHLIAWTLTYQGVHLPSTAIHGKLGKILGGVVRDQQQRTTGSNPWINPGQPFPADTNAIAVLWDGSIDPAFPFWDSGVSLPPFAPASFTYPLPLPIEIEAGRPLSIGIWLQPSLIAGGAINILNANYVITVDDGKPLIAGWGG